MYLIDDSGWMLDARHCPSPHFYPGVEQPSLIIVHSASLPYADFGNGVLEKVFTGKMSLETDPWLKQYMSGRVSAHALIDRRGDIVQFVSMNDQAWHAGNSSYQGRENCNQFSVGIELEGCDYLPYNDAQYVCLNAVIQAICARYPIRQVLGHSDIAPGRKTDPGPLFDWARVIKINR